jgi:hypothetical protein
MTTFNTLRKLVIAMLIIPLLWSSTHAEDVEKKPAPGEAITFNKHIAPLVFTSCTGCHRPGEVAPFPLQSFEDVSKRARQIARVTKSRYMPPWKAEPGFGDFHDSRRLSDPQVELFQRWIDGGSKEGDKADLPVAPKFTEGWQLGEPDLVLKMPEAFTLVAEGRDVYQCFVLPTNLTEDKFVTAIEFRPSNRRIVHHAILYLDNTGAARKKDAADPTPGFSSFGGPGFLPTGGLGGWAPGAFPRHLPDGIARPLKKGSDVIVQTHFHPSGKTETEQSTIGLYFAKKPPEKTLANIPLKSRDINIPPGEKNYKVTSSFELPCDVQVIGITPHAHLICKDMKGTARLPDGTTRPLIWISDWDFNWQEQYQYAKPLKLPQGTRLEMEFTYDNSADNIRNPNNPPRRVTFGEQTTEEMAFLFMQMVPEKASDVWVLRGAMIKELISGSARVAASKKFEQLKELAAKFDADGDGTLNDDERTAAWKYIKEEALKKKK